MKELLYYPNFFMEDTEWLKFALLYIDRVVTIVPTEANGHLSDTHKLILNETDLLNSHSPTSDEIDNAALKMGSELGLLIRNPINEFMVNGGPHKINEWRDASKFTHELFKGKYPLELQNMLKSYRLASESENGIITHRYVAFIYMTILAHIIAEERGISTITDVKNNIGFTNINKAVRMHQNQFNRYKTLTNNITIYLPRDIKDIELRSIIEFRNHPNNKRNLKEFQTAIEKLGLILNENTSENEMIDIKKEIFETKRNYIAGIAAQLGTGIASTIGVYQLINGDAEQLDFLREVLGLGILQGVQNIYGNINEFNNLRRSSSYISNIENLSRGSWKSRRARGIINSY
jgi:hypothetical protein